MGFSGDVTVPVCQTPSSGPGCLLGEFVYPLIPTKNNDNINKLVIGPLQLLIKVSDL